MIWNTDCQSLLALKRHWSAMRTLAKCASVWNHYCNTCWISQNTRTYAHVQLWAPPDKSIQCIIILCHNDWLILICISCMNHILWNAVLFTGPFQDQSLVHLSMTTTRWESCSYFSPPPYNCLLPMRTELQTDMTSCGQQSLEGRLQSSVLYGYLRTLSKDTEIKRQFFCGLHFEKGVK